MKGYKINPDKEYVKRTKYTPNEIRVDCNKKIAEIDVYDSFGKYRATGYISLEDVETIRPYKWYLDSTGYLRTTLPNGTKIRMHNLITGEKGIDHIDRNKLNNTRNNLRTCERWQNTANKKQYNSREVIGVYKKPKGSYVAYLECKGNRRIKTYKTKQEAIIQRFIWDLNIFGEFSPQLTEIEKRYPIMLLALSCGRKIIDDYNTIQNVIDIYDGKKVKIRFFSKKGEN